MRGTRLQQAVSARGPFLSMQEDEGMIVLGADTHKRSHTVAAVAARTGELLGQQTIPVGRCGFGALRIGRAGSMRTGCGRLRTAGTCPARWSGF